MAEAAERLDTPRSWWRWLLAVLLALVLLLAAAVPLGLWWLAETPRGRAFVAEQVSGLDPASGIRFQVGRIDGSLLSRFELVDVVVKDLDGTLALIPLAKVDWEPITLVSRLVSINRVDVPEIRILRMWKLNPRDPDEPLLPDIDIRVGRFDIAKLVLEKPVLGRREELRALGRADIRSGRVLLDMQAAATAGDRLLLLLDAEPDRDRFDLRADLRSPTGGMLTTAAGLDQPLALILSGNGSWTRWRGRLVAELGSGDTLVRLASLGIAADDGRFRVKGELNPAPFLAEPLAALAKPALDLDLTAGRDDDRFDIRLAASSSALAVTGGGVIDTRDNLLEAVRVDLVVKDPAALNPALSGQGLRASVQASGPVADPDLRWTAAADRVRFPGSTGPMGADAVAANGTVRLAAQGRPLGIGFNVSAGATTGLPPEQAALLANPRLSGNLTWADGTLRATNLALTTAQLSATGSGARLSDGRVTASVDGTLARLDVPGLGALTVRAVADINQAPGGRPVVVGRFDGRVLSLGNQGVADFLGGLPAATGNFTLGADGRILVSSASFRSPNLTFVGAHAGYDPATGRFSLEANGASRAYGPVSLVAGGTATAPTATLKLAAPGFGFGVTDVIAQLEPAPGGFLVTATGSSPQGPLDGRMRVGFGEGRPLTLDVDRAAIAGIEASGQLVQTAAGPFAGVLVVQGTGLEAQFRFAAQGRLQDIQLVATASNARIPLAVPIAITKGAARFDILLVPEKPHVTGSFRMAGVRRDTLVLTSVEGTANLAGSSGQASLTAAGRSGDGQPFKGTARVQSVSSGYAVWLDGMVGKSPLKLERPAQLVQSPAGWELKPARLRLPKGQVDFAGQWGKQRELRVVLNDVDLSIVDFLSRGAGLGGTASGQLVLRQVPGARIPTGEASLEVKGLQRAGVTGISIPIDLKLAGSSDGSGLVLGARMSWQGNELGRLVMRVDPGPGETPADRFMAGRLSGGVRYNGPVEPLWALVGLEGQDLRGPLAVGADFAGTPAQPQLAGIARGRGLVYRNAQFGTEITDINLDGSFTGSSLRIATLTGKANGGTLKGAGFVRLDADAEQQIDLGLELSNARLANSDFIEMTMSGPLALKGRLKDATLTGDLRVDSARIQLVQVETSEVPQLKVRRPGEIRVPDSEAGLSASNLKLDVRIRADDRVRVEGMGLDSVWRADVRVRGTASNPVLLGTATLARGEFTFAGSDFEITTGRVGFNGKPLDSSIDIQAQTRAQDVTAFVRISGTAARPDIAFSSTPALPEDEILARLLFGTSVADLSVTEAVQLATAIAGLQSGVDTMGKIRRSVGLDRLRLVGENSATGMGTGLAIGKRLSRNLYVEVITDSQGNTLTQVQLTLSRIWSLFIEVSSTGDNSVNVRYQREY
jgi:translocation and assembly module TamB